LATATLIEPNPVFEKIGGFVELDESVDKAADNL
jgi:hypothetical protein